MGAQTPYKELGAQILGRVAYAFLAGILTTGGAVGTILLKKAEKIADL
jgi:hypothetical protein